MSLSDYAENAMLDAVMNNTALQKSARYVKLHIGDPGENGTSNAAGETDRASVTGAAASGGVFTSVNDLEWLSVSTNETYSHVSLWDNISAGNCLGSGALGTPRAVVAGDNFTIETGDFTFTLT